jgi:hypothetical protein
MSILDMKRMKHEKVKQLVQVCIASNWQSWDLNGSRVRFLYYPVQNFSL